VGPQAPRAGATVGADQPRPPRRYDLRHRVAGSSHARPATIPSTSPRTTPATRRRSTSSSTPSGSTACSRTSRTRRSPPGTSSSRRT